jgi:hypothetical protein
MKLAGESGKFPSKTIAKLLAARASMLTQYPAVTSLSLLALSISNVHHTPYVI